MRRRPRDRAEVLRWPEARDVVVGVLSSLGAAAAVSGPHEPPRATWTDGPGPTRAVDALAVLSGWTIVEGLPAADVAGGERVLHLDRRLSDRALAVCLVRFYASQGRHWSSAEGTAFQQAWRGLTAADDPAECEYAIAAGVAELLLQADDPQHAGAPGHEAPRHEAGEPNRADTLSAKLAAIGYERLWAVAFAAAP